MARVVLVDKMARQRQQRSVSEWGMGGWERVCMHMRVLAGQVAQGRGICKSARNESSCVVSMTYSLYPCCPLYVWTNSACYLGYSHAHLHAVEQEIEHSEDALLPLLCSCICFLILRSRHLVRIKYSMSHCPHLHAVEQEIEHGGDAVSEGVVLAPAVDHLAHHNGGDKHQKGNQDLQDGGVEHRKGDQQLRGDEHLNREPAPVRWWR